MLVHSLEFDAVDDFAHRGVERAFTQRRFFVNERIQRVAHRAQRRGAHASDRARQTFVYRLGNRIRNQRAALVRHARFKRRAYRKQRQRVFLGLVAHVHARKRVGYEPVQHARTVEMLYRAAQCARIAGQRQRDLHRHKPGWGLLVQRGQLRVVHLAHRMVEPVQVVAVFKAVAEVQLRLHAGAQVQKSRREPPEFMRIGVPERCRKRLLRLVEIDLTERGRIGAVGLNGLNRLGFGLRLRHGPGRGCSRGGGRSVARDACVHDVVQRARQQCVRARIVALRRYRVYTARAVGQGYVCVAFGIFVRSVAGKPRARALAAAQRDKVQPRRRVGGQ